MFRRNVSSLLTLSLALCFVAVLGCSATSGGSSPKKGTATASAASGSNAATIDGQPIPMTQLDQRVARQIYEVRQQALEEMLNESLLEKEAKAQGISTEALLQKEVHSKVPDPSPAEIDQVWEANKARMAGKTKEQVTPEIVNWLKGQKGGQVQQTYLQGLRAKYKVQVLLEPPRVEVAVDDDPAKGPAGAPVTIVEFSDYQCPYCSRAESTIKQVLEKYQGKVRFVYRDYPLTFHPFAAKAAEASQCANEQGKFWEFHDALYADQAKLSIPDMQATASKLGINGDKFKACVESGKYTAEVNKDMADATKAGVNSTPSFFINGIAVVGAQGVDTFSQLIDQELAKAGK
ncbi:MAG TPA: thioredoxin domain-containing protein [Candidatus Polarisedimenticolia bacterium]|jgi:protein-disulfide isomerase|nr:thioredoxin domain-containing protein [Candidatus Polarisedimenticolia bacterium]